MFLGILRQKMWVKRAKKSKNRSFWAKNRPKILKNLKIHGQRDPHENLVRGGKFSQSQTCPFGSWARSIIREGPPKPPHLAPHGQFQGPFSRKSLKWPKRLFCRLVCSSTVDIGTQTTKTKISTNPGKLIQTGLGMGGFDHF